jgi:hypothetical protein
MIFCQVSWKIKKKFIYEAFESCNTFLMSFDLWMSRGMDTFVLIVHFLNHSYKFGHVTIGLFEIANAFGTRSWPYKLMRCYEHIASMLRFLHMWRMKVEILKYDLYPYFCYFMSSFEVDNTIYKELLGHVMFKCCQYAIDDTKVCVGLTLIFIKTCKFVFQKTIAWPIKTRKGAKSGKKHA